MQFTIFCALRSRNIKPATRLPRPHQPGGSIQQTIWATTRTRRDLKRPEADVQYARSRTGERVSRCRLDEPTKGFISWRQRWDLVEAAPVCRCTQVTVGTNRQIKNSHVG